MKPSVEKDILINETDSGLVKRSLEGDFEAYEKLVKKYEGKIYHFILKLTKNKEDAEDLLQKTFIKAYEKLSTFEGRAKFSTWLFSIAFHFFLMQKRSLKGIQLENLEDFKDKKELVDSNALIDWSERPDETLDKKELKEILDKSVDELPPLYKGVFLLKDLEGFSIEEISKMFNISISAVKTRLLRARLFLRGKLSEYFKR